MTEHGGCQPRWTAAIDLLGADSCVPISGIPGRGRPIQGSGPTDNVVMCSAMLK